MSYELIYTVPFSTLDRVSCIVEIEKDGYTGEVTELTPGDSPFTVDIEDEEFLYTPTRFSTATIRIVGSDYLQRLFSIAYQEYRVTFKKNGVVTWCGFIKPELYTQDYTLETFELELECMSAMSTLEFIDYKQEGENKVFVSLWDLLKKCISSAQGQYTGVCFPYVYAKSKADYDAGINVLKEMTVSEQDFFDEDDKPMKLKEVLEEICKFLNWTCTDWRGDLYFVDIEDTWRYDKYKADLSEKDSSVIPLLNDIQDIGFMGNGHSLDILPGYNKVTVKCSNYPVGNMFSQDEDYESLSVIQKPNDIVDNEKVCHRLFLKPESSKMQQYTLESEGIFKEVEDLGKYKGDINSLFGAVPMRFCNYEIKNGKPSINDYSYTDVIRVRLKPLPGFDTPLLGAYKISTKIKGACAIYSDGAISVNGLIKVLYNAEMSPLKTEYPYLTKSISVSIRVGNQYYTDSGWKKNGRNYKITLRRESEEEYLKIPNGKTLDMPYDGASGLIIPIDKMLIGDFEFILYNRDSTYDANEVGHLLKDFKIEYVKANISDNPQKDSDRLYENIVNEKYINELDEIEFKISSYNNDGACYSKVMLGDGYLTDNLYSAIEDTTIRPEEQLIRRIIKRYSAPRIKLTQEIKETSALTPISRLYDNYMVNKRFINAGGTIDYKMNKFQCIMIEI